MNAADDLSNSNDFSDRWQTMLDRNWQEQIDLDESEIDLDLLAACAEGRLSPEEESLAQEMMAASPAALETFLLMREEFNRHDVEQAVASTGAGKALPKSVFEGSLQRSKTEWPTAAMLATAASVFVAVFSGGWAITQRLGHSSYKSQIASLQGQLETAHNSLENQTRIRLNQSLMAEKELGVSLALEQSPVYLAGQISPSMLISTIQSLAVARGSKVETPAARTFRENIVERLGETILETGQADADNGLKSRLVETSMQQILSDNLEAASQTLAEIKTQFPDEPDVKNLEAVLLLAQAEKENVADAKPLISAAEQILKDLTTKDPSYSAAWLNLALLAESSGRSEPALPFWKGYLAHEKNADLRSVVEKRLNHN